LVTTARLTSVLNCSLSVGEIVVSASIGIALGPGSYTQPQEMLRDAKQASDALAAELKAHVKSTIAPYQYPRWIEFRDSLPKTATGKIQRFKLRPQAGA
jgi:acyl-CoA synthetase (AMP-forming)/AMP-acid ligase II